VSEGLQHTRFITKILKSSSPQVHQGTSHLPPNPRHQEDAIKTSSLHTLATSHNIDIRNAAIKILCQRFYANDTAKRLLVRDLGSHNANRRHAAQLAYNLLYDNNVIRLPPPPAHEGWRLHEPAPAPPAADDQDLRRRRREAVVIHDGDADRPIGQEDVFMRDATGDLERAVHPGEPHPLEMSDLERRFQLLSAVDGATRPPPIAGMTEAESDENDRGEIERMRQG
jgi:hypothetical protein